MYYLVQLDATTYNWYRGNRFKFVIDEARYRSKGFTNIGEMK